MTGRLRPCGRFCQATLLTTLLCLASTAQAGSFGSLGEWFDNNMIDPQDGKVDLSNYLASAHGFLPVPIIITEPAVGFGLGAAVAYFHEQNELDPEVHPHNGPPSISVGFGAKTDNGTYFYGGAHSGVWKDDHIRYLGALAKINANLTFYPEGSQVAKTEDGIGFNVDGSFLLQKMQFRLRESNWWLGANYIYINAENSFDVDPQLDSLPSDGFEFEQGGLGVTVEYDGRNTTFTPTKGLRASFEYRNYDENWGSDFDYDHLLGKIFHYTPFGSYSSLGVRLQGETVSGEVPFFAYPFVSLRGIPAMRYQGEDVLTGELEYLWGITPRWTLVFFGGVGKTSAIGLFGNDGETVGAGGVGFRYRLARKQGLQAGVDVARGPEETSIYLTIGSTWQ